MRLCGSNVTCFQRFVVTHPMGVVIGMFKVPVVHIAHLLVFGVMDLATLEGDHGVDIEQLAFVLRETAVVEKRFTAVAIDGYKVKFATTVEVAVAERREMYVVENHDAVGTVADDAARHGENVNVVYLQSIGAAAVEVTVVDEDVVATFSIDDAALAIAFLGMP